jgi:hypothetical protein
VAGDQAIRQARELIGIQSQGADLVVHAVLPSDGQSQAWATSG